MFSVGKVVFFLAGLLQDLAKILGFNKRTTKKTTFNSASLTFFTKYFNLCSDDALPVAVAQVLLYAVLIQGVPTQFYLYLSQN